MQSWQSGPEKGVWGSLSVRFLVRHILAHEAKCVTVCGSLAGARTFQAECLSSAVVRSAFMWTKKQAWVGSQAVIQINFSCTLCPSEGRWVSVWLVVAKAALSIIFCKVGCCSPVEKPWRHLAMQYEIHWKKQCQLIYSVLVLSPTQGKNLTFFKEKLLQLMVLWIFVHRKLFGPQKIILLSKPNKKPTKQASR